MSKITSQLSAALADRYKIDEMGPGWTFLTGRPRDIELLRRRLGFAYDDRLDADRTNHIRLILMGNEPYGWWGTAPGADMSANQLTKLVEWLAPGSWGMQGPPETWAAISGCSHDSVSKPHIRLAPERETPPV